MSEKFFLSQKPGPATDIPSMRSAIEAVRNTNILVHAAMNACRSDSRESLYLVLAYHALVSLAETQQAFSDAMATAVVPTKFVP